MATQNVRNIAPFINVTFYITSPWWTERWGTIHRGLDIATSTNDPVYSMLTGHVREKSYDSSQGNYIVIANDIAGTNNYGYATRYMHLDSISKNLGDSVSALEQIGIEGTTGESTGIHLHVEMQDISRFNWTWHWSYTKSDYLDPTVFMGIDNIEGTSWIYDGTPIPPTPTRKKKKFPWVLYANKLRNVNRKM